ncbi:CBL-interacting protein kinase 8 [Diplonema papillatum]|nr:CBL-interacting protein kinase 8 [Diplonema papillatum]
MLNTDRRRCKRCLCPRSFPGSPFCIAHKCKGNCFGGRCGTSEYCEDHKCQLCDASVAESSTYCVAHKCKEECPAPRCGVSEYCEDHKCLLCSGERQPRSNFCAAHKCLKTDCPEAREDDAQYCKTHASTSSLRMSALDSLVQLGNYEVGDVLGAGSFSQVRLGFDTEKERKVAIKIAPFTNMQRDLLSVEISLLMNLNHENMVTLLDIFRTSRCVYLVLEFCSGGELFTLIANSGSLEEKLARKYSQDLVTGLCYLHSMSVCHRDLKPENLLLCNDVLKIADFGFATWQSEGARCVEALGTPEYKAPEVVPIRSYDGFSADMWSCGVVLFTMVQGMVPFDGRGDDRALLNEIAKGLPPFRGAPPQGAVDVITMLVVHNPTKRPTAHQLLVGDNDVPAAPWVQLETDDKRQQQLFPKNHKPPAANPGSDLNLTPISSPSVIKDEALLFGDKSWSLTYLIEEATDFFATLGKPTHAPPAKAMPRRTQVRPNQWRGR